MICSGCWFSGQSKVTDRGVTKRKRKLSDGLLICLVCRMKYGAELQGFVKLYTLKTSVHEVLGLRRPPPTEILCVSLSVCVCL